MKKVTVVGAGFSGMSLAYFLNKKGCTVTVIEKQDRVGGMISTGETLHGIYETAANGFLNTAAVEKFLSDIQADYIGSSQYSKKRYIFRGHPRRWPFTFTETFKLFLKVLFFLLQKKINQMAVPRESLVGWSDQRFPHIFADYLLAPALQGIYAGDIQRLSASLIINPMITRKREKKLSASSLLSSKKGMGSLMVQLKEYLQQKGVEFQLNFEWHPFLQTDHLVIATSARDAERILRQIPNSEAKDNAELLKKIEMAPLVTVTCYFRQRPKNYQGFGVLFPRLEKIKALGVLMNSVIFDRDSQVHSETWIYGGALDRDFIFQSDEQVKNSILEDRARAFSESQELIEIKITRWPQGLPHYTIEHEKILSQLKPIKKISLHGNYMGRIGLSRILEKSEQLADKIMFEVP